MVRIHEREGIHERNGLFFIGYLQEEPKPWFIPLFLSWHMNWLKIIPSLLYPETLEVPIRGRVQLRILELGDEAGEKQKKSVPGEGVKNVQTPACILFSNGKSGKLFSSCG